MKLINCSGASIGVIFLAFIVISLGQLARADYMVFETAPLGPTGQTGGYDLSDAQYMGARFYFQRGIEVTQIGGHISQGIVAADLFGAIVPLSGQFDLPAGNPFTAGEVVASTVFDPGYPSTDFRTPLSVILSPGYYALIFGTNALGSVGGSGKMPYLGQTSYPDSSYIVWQYGVGWWSSGLNNTRFVIEGNVGDILFYCDAEGSTYSEHQYIMGVQVGTINNIPTGNDHYADYTSLSTTMEPAVTYPITVTRGNPWDIDYDYCGTWVDWNQDGDFYDLNERITMSIGVVDPCTFTGTITPPLDAVMGNTRMRVRILWNEAILPCGGTLYGEVEDYTITIPGLYGGGGGTAEDPYLIRTAEHMNEIGSNPDDWDKHFMLVADIDMSAYTGTAYNIIGTGIADPFTGTFDGNDHTISNFTYTTTGTDYVGLFGYIQGVDAQIKDLGLIDPVVNAGTGDYVGALAAYVQLGTITGCYVGRGSVSGNNYVGGLVAFNASGTIATSYTTTDVSANNDYVGGLAGLNSDGDISDCYARGSVSGDVSVGGLVGDNEGTVSRCYSAGLVTGSGSYLGGLIGQQFTGATWDSFWDKDTSGLDGSAGGIRKTTMEMYSRYTYSMAGWDFLTPVWTICHLEDYPTLSFDPAKYGGGSGTEQDPYLIFTSCQINRIGADPNDWDKHFRLMRSIDLSGFSGDEFNIIGGTEGDFSGGFDGNYHLLYNFNFTYSPSEYMYLGIFGKVNGQSAQIKNLGLINPRIEGGPNGQIIGSLVGELSSGNVSNCFAKGGSVSGDWTIGGLIGRSWGTIENCYSLVDVSGDDFAGGLAGVIQDGAMNDCYSAGKVSGGNPDHTGGLIGGNLMGQGVITDSFWDTEASGQPYNPSLPWGTPKTTFQMQMESTFTYAGWDFTTPVWKICEGADYPRLWWESCWVQQSAIRKWVAFYHGHEQPAFIDIAHDIAADDLGNVYVTGESVGEGMDGPSYDFATVKYAPDGDELWVARYDGPVSSSDFALAIAVDNAGNTYVTGESYGDGTGTDFATVKYDPNGSELWVVRYNSQGGEPDGPEDIAVDDSGNVYVTGGSYSDIGWSDFCTIKYDSNGVELWVAMYSGPAYQDDWAMAMTLDDSGNVYVTGISRDLITGCNYATVKYDPNGVKQWVAGYNGPADDHDYAYDIDLDDSGNVYVTGRSIGNGSDSDTATIKYDANGTELWVARYNGPGNDYDEALSIVTDDSGNVYVGGTSVGVGTSGDYTIIKYEPNGTELWVARYNGSENLHDRAAEIALDNAANVYITGASNFEMFKMIPANIATIKYDTNGNELWKFEYSASELSPDIGYGIAVDGSRNVYITGSSTVGSAYLTARYAHCSYPGDLDNDFDVDFGDYAILALRWLDKDCGQCGRADLTGNEDVGFDDLKKYAEYWLAGF